MTSADLESPTSKSSAADRDSFFWSLDSQEERLMSRGPAIVLLLILISVLQVAVLYAILTRSSRITPIEAVRDAPTETVINLGVLPVDGAQNAPVVLVEFGDYECPYCARHASGVLSKLREKYVSTGVVRYAFVHNPLPMHVHAELMASAVICAGEQGQFWPMHDRVFQTQPRIRSFLLLLAEELAVDSEAFRTCIDGPIPRSTLARDRALSESLDFRSTPMFALGRSEDLDRVRVETLIAGAHPLSVFEDVIDNLTELRR